ncbi:50S ribosomal protein L7/L12 [Patescibacteria group bacterium]|nr:50S ribosomal protein L7/L12 [Patescibacteria group bacterium]
MSEDKKNVEIPTKFKDLVEQIEKLSVLDLAELVKVLEEKFGVAAAAPVMATAAAPAPAEATADKEEKSTFNIELKAAGDQKINVIKVVREMTGLGLKEAKDMVDGAPKIVKENVKKEEAEEIRKKLSEAGATVELK